MTSIFDKLTRRPVAVGALTFLMLGTQSALQADPAKVQTFEQDALPLAEAIAAYSETTGIEVLASADAVAGKTAPALSGDLSVKEALEELLAGSDLEYSFVSDESVAISRPRVEEATSASRATARLAEVTLTGELIERDLQDSQTSATVALGADLSRRGDKDVYDLIERTPNVTPTGGGNVFSIRGVGTIGTVAVQVDGADARNSQFVYPNWDLDQIEILRGPQSTQQGRNALAGAVIIRTKDPEYFDEYKLRGGVGSDELKEGAFMANKVLVDDKVAIRIAGQDRRDDGFITNTTLGIDDTDRIDFENYRAKIRFTPYDNLDIVLSHSYDRTDNGVARAERTFFPDDFVETSDIDTFSDNEYHQTGLRVSYEFAPGWSLESETTYRDGGLSGLAEIAGAPAVTESDETFTQQELRLVFDQSSFNGVLGLFYYDSSFESSTLINDRITVPGFLDAEVDATTDSGSDVKNYALFGEVEIDLDHWLEGLSLIAGARFDFEKNELTNEAEAVLGTVFADPLGLAANLEDSEATSRDEEFDAFVPKLGLIYDFNENSSVSFTYQQGYRAGGSNDALFVDPAIDPDFDTDFDPEFTENLEIAFRNVLLDGRLIANANLFYTFWKDQQVRQETNSGQNFIVNAGESELYGGEVAVDYLVTDRLSLNLSVGYVRTEFTQFITFEGGQEIDRAGDEFTDAPEWTGSVGAEYNFGNGLNLLGDVAFTDSRIGNLDNPEDSELKSYALTNLALTYDRDYITFGVFVRNLFDKRYAESGNTVNVTPGEPRTFGAYVELTF
ncbi:MAG: TonB-dependent receptor [Verrucomicrobiota bacterium]